MVDGPGLGTPSILTHPLISVRHHLETPCRILEQTVERLTTEKRGQTDIPTSLLLE